MLQLNASSASGNVSIGRKTSYNRHFPRSFLLKYGPALQDPTDNAILNRLHSWNCEWLSRLNIAISELAMTTKDNMPLIRQFHGTLFCDQFLDDLLSSFDHLLPALSRLDNKDKTDQTPPSREDVVSLLRNLDQDTDLRQCIMNGFNAAGLLMMLVTQVLAIQTLMRNAEDFADKVSKEAQHQPFKEDPSPRGMRSYILNSITKKRRNMRITLRSRRGQGPAGASSSTPGMKTGVRNSPVLHNANAGMVTREPPACQTLMKMRRTAIGKCSPKKTQRFQKSCLTPPRQYQACLTALVKKMKEERQH